MVQAWFAEGEEPQEGDTLKVKYVRGLIGTIHVELDQDPENPDTVAVAEGESSESLGTLTKGEHTLTMTDPCDETGLSTISIPINIPFPGGRHRNGTRFAVAGDPGCSACCSSDSQCVSDLTTVECQEQGGVLLGSDNACEEVACPPIPAISEWGMIVITVLLLTAGTIVFGRRRRPAPA